MIIQGRVTKVEFKEGVSQNTGNPWKRVDFEVEYKEVPTDRNYDKVKLESFHEDVINNLQEGMIVKATISHKVGEYDGKTYNRIILNEVHCVRNQAQVMTEQYAQAAQQNPAPAASQEPAPEPPAEDPDDLPF